MRTPDKIQKVTVNLPASLLKQAKKSTGKGTTETIRAALKLMAARDPYRDFMKLKGKFPDFMSYDELKRQRE